MDKGGKAGSKQHHCPEFKSGSKNLAGNCRPMVKTPKCELYCPEHKTFCKKPGHGYKTHLIAEMRPTCESELQLAQKLKAERCRRASEEKCRTWQEEEGGGAEGEGEREGSDRGEEVKKCVLK